MFRVHFDLHRFGLKISWTKLLIVSSTKT